MGKHAYLIMAHNQVELLKKLIECLDHERTDIFVHIDKKSKIEASDLEQCVKKSKMYFTDRIKVTWGGQAKYGLNCCFWKKQQTQENTIIIT